MTSYSCNTCGKTLPTFQALGGHHKSRHTRWPEKDLKMNFKDKYIFLLSLSCKEFEVLKFLQQLAEEKISR